MNFYPHHIGDYLTATAHLTWVEDCAYRRLIDIYYSKEKPIPSDFSQASRLVRATSKDERRAVETVLNEFFVATPEGWVHGRCEAEIEKARVTAARSKSNGMKGGRPTKRAPSVNPEITHWDISGFPDGTHSEPNPKAPNTNTNPITNYSEPDGSGADAPPTADLPAAVKPGKVAKPKLTDPADIIFGYGLSMLTNAGTKDATARSFLGGLRKVHGDAALINKLRDCAHEKPLQPLEWLAAALPPPHIAGKPNAQEALEAANAAVAAQFLAQDAHAAQ